MREIKFRGKSVATGLWVYGYLVHTGDWPEGDESDKNLRDYWVITNGYTQEEIDVKTVGQYTGLKDKNGKDIYESDILNKNFVVGRGSAGGCGCCDRDISYGWFFDEYNLPENSVVIGNIYENPELLTNN